MIEVLEKDVFDDLINSCEVPFLGSSIYGIANEMFDNEHILIGIKKDGITKPILILKEKLEGNKNYHFILYDNNTLSISKILDSKEQKELNKFLKKNKCLYYTLISEGSESRNIKKEFYHLELNSNIIDYFDLEVQSNINNSYKFPLNLIDVNITNVHHFCKLFSTINREKVTKYINNGLKLKLVTLDTVEYINNLTKQKKELLLKRTEEKLYVDKDDDFRIMEIDNKVANIEQTIETLEQLQHSRGNILYLAAGIFIEYKDCLIEYKSVQDSDFNELNARYYMSFKMLKYGIQNNLKHYYNMNDDNILHNKSINIYESKENIVKKISYKLYKRRKDKKHD